MHALLDHGMEDFGHGRVNAVEDTVPVTLQTPFVDGGCVARDCEGSSAG